MEAHPAVYKTYELDQIALQIGKYNPHSNPAINAMMPNAASLAGTFIPGVSLITAPDQVTDHNGYNCRKCAGKLLPDRTGFQIPCTNDPHRAGLYRKDWPGFLPANRGPLLRRKRTNPQYVSRINPQR